MGNTCRSHTLVRWVHIQEVVGLTYAPVGKKGNMTQALPESIAKSPALLFVVSQGWEWREASNDQIAVERKLERLVDDRKKGGTDKAVNERQTALFTRLLEGLNSKPVECGRTV